MSCNKYFPFVNDIFSLLLRIIRIIFSHIYPSTLKYVDNPLFRIINQNGYLLWRNVCDYNLIFNLF
ncbi:hypothetical protein XBFFL1_140033 [Xenorhabdus bovienii str. feltiae Florida]|uniref:Uncharacterized protein n=3 Tax=Xenorhabdus bovienii TaxID=40576 RepID=A0A0B6XBJ3_XENBV|nr:hypothetical protein XBFFR1_80033 [Xenorhabdus bovienii str. feltiae France]CDG91222.1 hypothetical protein XBFFL1_140033 [Xenorhabdus bovienii str. feltiae Florida]CDH03612.1 hypothetical protein XBFM1_820027 [Xenorhabdus bovienii str. feltiae Moldova]CDH23984.1 hypothetical protein XBKB1_230008 [Xenorhabdus bovienii str. kraussei Becker Underwood]CDM90950.1 protein of unknown function [Xenorhabdus bovienii]